MSARRACASSVASQVGRNRTGAGASAVGQRRARQVEELGAVLGPEAPRARRARRPLARPPAAARPSRRTRRRSPARRRRGSDGRAARPRPPRPRIARPGPALRVARTDPPCGAPTSPTAARGRGRPTGRSPRSAPCPTTSTIALRGIGSSPRRSRNRAAARSISASETAPRRVRSHHARRASRTATANGHQSRRETRWIVERSSVPWITVLRSSARVRASRSSPSVRDQSPMYIDGAYCACRPPIRSSTREIGSRLRSSSRWRARTARFSSRDVRTRSVNGRRGRPRQGRASAHSGHSPAIGKCVKFAAKPVSARMRSRTASSRLGSTDMTVPQRSQRRCSRAPSRVSA